MKREQIYIQNWPAYNQARQDRVVLLPRLLKDLVQHVEEPAQLIGRPRLCTHDLLTCSVLKVASQWDGRGSKALFLDLQKQGIIESVPCDRSISGFLNSEDTTAILEGLLERSVIPFRKAEMVVAIDSTGFTTNAFGSYCQHHYTPERHHSWLKAHCVVGVDTHAVLAIIIGHQHSADTAYFRPLLEKILKNGFQPTEVCADKAYLSHKNLQFADDHGISPYVPFRKNSRRRGPLSAPAWHSMYRHAHGDPKDFERRYHQRSNVEAAFSAIKRTFGDGLKSRNFLARKNELLCKVLAYNLGVLTKAMYEHGTPES